MSLRAVVRLVAIRQGWLLAAALAAASLSSCGYALVGRGTVVDPSIKRIGVPLFKNVTGRASLDEKITKDVVEELLKRGRFDVVQTATGVDAVVEGELLSYRDDAPVGFTGVGTAAAGLQTTTQATRYEVVLVAKVRYAKTGVTEPIWSNDSFQFRDEYDLGSDPSNFVDRRAQALDRISNAFARSLVASMLEAF